jgi:membrane fusion protein, heavy metal efflux system
MAMVGCSSKPAPAPVTAPDSAKADKNVVVLEAAAQRDAGIESEPAQQRAIAQVIRATGRLTNSENATFRVGAVTDGRIAHVQAKVGDVVKEGQLLAEMHSHDIHESRALYQKSLTDLSRLKTNVVFAQRQRDRMKRLVDLKAASQEQYESTDNELKNATTALQNGEVEVNRTRNHLVEFLGVAADPPSGSDVEDHIPIKSPAPGIVLTRNVTVGSVVNPSNDLFVISDLASLWTIANVQEEFLSKIHPGMVARIIVQAYADRIFTGKVAKIGEVLDAATRTVPVRIDTANTSGLLKPEMYAQVEFDSGGQEQALTVPETAVQDVNGQTVVFVKRDATHFEVHAVELGRSTAGRVVIVRGVSPGDAVITRGGFVLKSQLLKASLAEE